MTFHCPKTETGECGFSTKVLSQMTSHLRKHTRWEQEDIDPFLASVGHGPGTLNIYSLADPTGQGPDLNPASLFGSLWIRIRNAYYFYHIIRYGTVFTVEQVPYRYRYISRMSAAIVIFEAVFPLFRIRIRFSLLTFYMYLFG